jgi:hypothetical protein
MREVFVVLFFTVVILGGAVLFAKAMRSQCDWRRQLYDSCIADGIKDYDCYSKVYHRGR